MLLAIWLLSIGCAILLVACLIMVFMLAKRGKLKTALSTAGGLVASGVVGIGIWAQSQGVKEVWPAAYSVTPGLVKVQFGKFPAGTIANVDLKINGERVAAFADTLQHDTKKGCVLKWEKH
jgi:hypothetical protein